MPTGCCGGWANLLIHMWKIHRVDTAHRRSFIRSLYPKGLNFKKRFLVKNLDFSAPPDIKAGLYTHTGISAQKQNGVPGQGKKNPQFDFGDHVIVTHNGNYFDPSYGIDGFATDKDYVEFAIGGLGGNGSVGFTMADATPQFISNECVEYNRGFIQYKISQDLCMAGLAARLAVSEDLVLHWNPGLKAWRGTPTGIEVGDEVEIPSGVQYINVTSTNPFSAIALSFGIPEDQLLARNSALSACGSLLLMSRMATLLSSRLILGPSIKSNPRLPWR